MSQVTPSHVIVLCTLDTGLSGSSRQCSLFLSLPCLPVVAHLLSCHTCMSHQIKLADPVTFALGPVHLLGTPVCGRFHQGFGDDSRRVFCPATMEATKPQESKRTLLRVPVLQSILRLTAVWVLLGRVQWLCDLPFCADTVPSGRRRGPLSPLLELSPLRRATQLPQGLSTEESPSFFKLF